MSAERPNIDSEYLRNVDIHEIGSDPVQARHLEQPVFLRIGTNDLLLLPEPNPPHVSDQDYLLVNTLYAAQDKYQGYLEQLAEKGRKPFQQRHLKGVQLLQNGRRTMIGCDPVNSDLALDPSASSSHLAVRVGKSGLAFEALALPKPELYAPVGTLIGKGGQR